MNRYGCFLIVCLLLVLQSGCGTTVQPGQRGLRWYPFTEGLTTNTLKSGFYWRAPWNDVFTYDLRWQGYVESVDALSSDDLLVKLRAPSCGRFPMKCTSLPRKSARIFILESSSPSCSPPCVASCWAVKWSAIVTEEARMHPKTLR